MARRQPLLVLTVVLLFLLCWILLRGERTASIDASSARDNSIAESDVARELEGAFQPGRELIGPEHQATPTAPGIVMPTWSRQASSDVHVRGTLLGATGGVIVVIADSSAVLDSARPQGRTSNAGQIAVAVAPVASDGSFDIVLPSGARAPRYRIIAVSRDGIAIGDAVPDQPVMLYVPQSDTITLGVNIQPIIESHGRGSVDVFWAPDQSTPCSARASRLDYLRSLIEVDVPGVLELANALCWRSVEDVDSSTITCRVPGGAAPTFGTSRPQTLILRQPSGELALRGVDDDTIEHFRAAYAGADVYEFATSLSECGVFPTGVFTSVREILVGGEWIRDADTGSVTILGGVGRIRSGDAPRAGGIYRVAVIDQFGARLVATPAQHAQGAAVTDPAILRQDAGQELLEYLGLSASIVSYRSVRCSFDADGRGLRSFVPSNAGVPVRLTSAMTACFHVEAHSGHAAALNVREVFRAKSADESHASARRTWALVWSLPHRDYVVLPEVPLDIR